MPPMPADEFDKSISSDSVFDWGFYGHSFKGLRGSFTSGSGGGSAKNMDDDDKATISRYDPRTMNRISDDLVDVDDDSASSDDENIVGRAGTERGGRIKIYWRQVVIIVSLIGIIVAASVAMGYAILGGGSAGNERGKPAYSVGGGEGGTMMTEQQLLELSQRIVMACSETSLNEDMSGCQDLCHENMCCFEKDNYNCEEDALKNCPVFGGCEALMGMS